MSATYIYIGKDDWYRDLFRRQDGEVFVDVDGILHTRTPDWGEPCCPIGVETPKVKDNNE